MIEQLDRIIDDVEALHSRLILLISKHGAPKRSLLNEFALSHGKTVLNIGSELGSRLVTIPTKQRSLAVSEALREMADVHASGGVVLVDNVEILFDRSLQLDPLDLLKLLARTRRVVAVWPGQLQNGRLIYAEMGHPEYQDYSIDGLVPFEIQ